MDNMENGGGRMDLDTHGGLWYVGSTAEERRAVEPKAKG
jgi:hypothetical protein